MTEQLNINLAPQIRQAYAEANAIAEKAKGYASEAVAKAIECGQLLIRQKESLGHGSWLEWLDKNLPGITDRTAQRYMRVAKAALKLSSQSAESNTTHVSYLENAPTLRQAYVALGMFPKPIDKSEQPDPCATLFELSRGCLLAEKWPSRDARVETFLVLMDRDTLLS